MNLLSITNKEIKMQKLYIYRDFSRPLEDDYKINVQHQLSQFKESVEIFHEGVVVGWVIQNRYE